MIKMTEVNMIEVGDWDALVEKTYGRPYSFQQQDGCKGQGIFRITIPSIPNDFVEDSIAEEVNGTEMGVSFKAWLSRDPKNIDPFGNEWRNNIFWERNFYPDAQMVANDLFERGLIPKGEYIINIDW